MGEPSDQPIEYQRPTNYPMVFIAVSAVVAALALTAGTVFGIIHDTQESDRAALRDLRDFTHECEDRASADREQRYEEQAELTEGMDFEELAEFHESEQEQQLDPQSLYTSTYDHCMKKHRQP